MVRLHIKRGDESQFLFETSVDETVKDVALEVCTIFNGRLKVHRICYEIEELAEHGTTLPEDMMGLTDEQITELKLVDVWAEKCIPSGGYIFNKDEIGRRNGRQPQENMQAVLKKSVADAREMINKTLVLQDQPMQQKIIDEALMLLKGAVTIVYPMQLPPHDPIRMELNNTEDLAGTQASKEIIEPAKCVLWFAGHQMLPEQKISDYTGKYNKSKIVVKIGKSGEGPPGREPSISEATRNLMMAEAYRRQEQLKKLQQDDDDSYLNSSWSDNTSLKRQVHGMEDIKFRMGM